MRRELQQAELRGVLLDDMPDDLLRDAVAPCPSCSANAPEQPPTGNSSGHEPIIECLLDLVRIGNGPDVACLPNKVNDRPMVFATLEMVEG